MITYVFPLNIKTLFVVGESDDEAAKRATGFWIEKEKDPKISRSCLGRT